MSTRFSAIIMTWLLVASPALGDSLSFDNWTIGFDSSDNHFASGPTITTRPHHRHARGNNSMSFAFSNTVFSPGTSNVNVPNPNFYYTLPMFDKLNSPTLNVVAGDTYAIQFHVDASTFNSTANNIVSSPSVTFEYYNPNDLNPGGPRCGYCVLLLIQTPVWPYLNTSPPPNYQNISLTDVSLDFVSPVSGPIQFAIGLSTGRR
jgi:hypothetical protein